MIRPASRSEVKPLIGLYSESGHGKTYGALLLAKGFTGDMSKVVMIETESGRGEAFAEDADVGGYSVRPIRDNFSPVEYGIAISEVNKDPANFKVLIVDSGSHEWQGAGGVLSLAADREKEGKKGMLVWQEPKMLHQREFMLRLLGTPIPLVILCMRAKYPMKQGIVNGKKDWIRSEELEPIQAEDVLFEMMVHAWIDKAHNLRVTKYSKDELMSVFLDGQPITIETGQRLADWSKGVTTSKPDTLPITASEAADLQALAEEVGADTDKFKEYYKIETFADLPASKYKQAIINLTSKRQQPA